MLAVAVFGVPADERFARLVAEIVIEVVAEHAFSG